ncbi:hypothetical protein CDAR_443691 [Caerostris darwini]|uniref:Uncharacterized protein n=1 Tax=Caerostris darwini TaxID=1538125 RepID=A0AAV4TN02_9ARAC|nr:hypothetical protein CDAR_443691 [Caerostris darwini]
MQTNSLHTLPSSKKGHQKTPITDGTKTIRHTQTATCDGMRERAKKVWSILLGRFGKRDGSLCEENFDRIWLAGKNLMVAKCEKVCLDLM